MWRYSKCTSTSRELSAETIRTGFITENGKRRRVHAGLDTDAKTFRRRLRTAEAHGLLNTAERADKRYGFRAITIFHVYPDRVLAELRGENLPATITPRPAEILPTVHVRRREFCPAALGKKSASKRATEKLDSASAGAVSFEIVEEIASALEPRWIQQDQRTPAEAAAWIVANWSDIHTEGIRRPKPHAPKAAFVAAFPISFIRAWNRQGAPPSAPPDDAIAERNRALAAALMGNTRTSGR